jgi:hypothetical protein
VFEKVPVNLTDSDIAALKSCRLWPMGGRRKVRSKLSDNDDVEEEVSQQKQHESLDEDDDEPQFKRLKHGDQEHGVSRSPSPSREHVSKLSLEPVSSKASPVTWNPPPTDRPVRVYGNHHSHASRVIPSSLIFQL